MESQQRSGIGAAVAVGAAPLMTREAFAAAIGLPASVLIGQAEKGYWPQIAIGKRVFINVEAVRLKAIECGQEFDWRVVERAQKFSLKVVELAQDFAK